MLAEAMVERTTRKTLGNLSGMTTPGWIAEGRSAT